MTNVDEAALAELAETAHALSHTLRRTGEQHLDLAALPGSEHDLLRFVHAHPGCSISEAARALRLQTSNVSATVRSLMERGLLTRAPDPRDGRRRMLHPSDTALEHRDRLQKVWARTLSNTINGLSEEEARVLRDAIPALTQLTDMLMTGARPHDPPDDGADRAAAPNRAQPD